MKQEECFAVIPEQRDGGVVMLETIVVVEGLVRRALVEVDEVNVVVTRTVINVPEIM